MSHEKTVFPSRNYQQAAEVANPPDPEVVLKVERWRETVCCWPKWFGQQFRASLSCRPAALCHVPSPQGLKRMVF
jgi:hypothetical protein